MEILFSSWFLLVRIAVLLVGIALFLIWLLDCYQCNTCPCLIFLILSQWIVNVNTLWKDFLKYFFVSVNLLTLNSLSHYVVIVNTKNTIFSKKYFDPILPEKCSIILYSYSPDPKQKHIFDFGKMGKNRRIKKGGY